MAKRAKATDLIAIGMERIGRKAIGQQVVSRILELIQAGSLGAGDRLPPERELIEIFSISRPSLREALRALSTLGVVRSQHGGGAYVSDLEARTLLGRLDFYISLTKANFADAFDSRRVIEIEIVRRAATKATRADVSDLRDKLNHRGISAGASHQAFAGSLAEGEPKLDSRHGADQGLMDVFDGLDEMGLSEDEIRRVRLVDPDRSELHGHLLAPAMD